MSCPPIKTFSILHMDSDSSMSSEETSIEEDFQSLLKMIDINLKRIQDALSLIEVMHKSREDRHNYRLHRSPGQTDLQTYFDIRRERN